MADISGLTGTPWHTETLRIGENDKRRHRSYCAYYNNKEKTCGKLLTKCCGSSRCPFYKECLEKNDSSKAYTSHRRKSVSIRGGGAIVYRPNTAPYFETAVRKKIA